MSSVILVVEDDPAIRRGLVDALTFGGYQVRECADGETAANRALESPTDLVLLDVLLPGKNGFELLNEIRRHRPQLPIIMLTARGSESDRIRGLQGGADDYVVKPFSAKELLARVKAVLRRSPQRGATLNAMTISGRTIDFNRQEARLPDGSTSSLTEREVCILRYLAQNDGRPVTREDLLRHVWGLDPQGLRTRTVDMHIVRLREKLGDDSAEHRIIQTVRAKGYMLSEAAKTR